MVPRMNSQRVSALAPEIFEGGKTGAVIALGLGFSAEMKL
jgi:hypothetical protein